MVCRESRYVDFLKNQVVKGMAMPGSLLWVGFMIFFLIVLMVRLMVMVTARCIRVLEYSLMMMMRHQVVTQEG